MEREHFSRIYDAELYEIREKLLEMGGKVEMMINNAMKSLVERDSELAERGGRPRRCPASRCRGPASPGVVMRWTLCMIG